MCDDRRSLYCKSIWSNCFPTTIKKQSRKENYFPAELINNICYYIGSQKFLQELNEKALCICKFGYFPARATHRCIPNRLLPHFLGKGDGNCSHLVEDLSKLYPELFFTSKANQSKALGVKISPSIDDPNGIISAYETAISLDQCNPNIKESCPG